MATRCPFSVWRPITTNYGTGGRQRIRGFVPHVQVGNGSLFGFFNTPKPPGKRASADFWCSKAGTLEQYVDLADQSYAQGSKLHNGNPYMVSCEFEGYTDEPMSARQLDVGGKLIAWVQTDVNPFALVTNVVPGDEGITPHRVFGGGHTCPGPGPREGQFPDLIAAAERWLSPHQPPSEDDLVTYTYVKKPNDGTVYVARHGEPPVHVGSAAFGFEAAEAMVRYQGDKLIPSADGTEIVDAKGVKRKVLVLNSAESQQWFGLP